MKEIVITSIKLEGDYVQIGKNPKWFRKGSITVVYNGIGGGAVIIINGSPGCETFSGITAEEIVSALT